MSVLSDHKKVGKRFIPPLNTIGIVHDVNWLKDIVPEIIWIALINDKLGWRGACHTIADMCRITAEINDKNNYAFISSYSKLNHDELREINNRLQYSDLLSKLDYSLFNFIEFYPECPLNFIYKSYIPKETVDVRFLLNYKKVLGKIYDKRSRESTFLLTSVIYSMLSTKKLNITKDSSLANLEEVTDYPNSDISQQIASSLRASINVFFNDNIYEKNSDWIKYFWNKGISLEPCKI